MVDRFRERRVFLAGDASHIHSPTGGQGITTTLGGDNMFTVNRRCADFAQWWSTSCRMLEQESKREHERRTNVMTTNMGILIVDDHLSLQMLLTTFLESAGYS